MATAVAYCSGSFRALGTGSGITAMPSSSQRLGLFARRLAADAAFLGFAVVDAARFVGEALADVFGVGHHVAHHLHPAACSDVRPAHVMTSWRGAGLRSAEVQARRAEHLADTPCRRTAGTRPARARAGPGSHPRSANQPSKPWLWEHWRLRTFMACLPIDRLPVELPCARQDVLQPQRAGQGLGVGDPAVAAPGQQFRRAWR